MIRSLSTLALALLSASISFAQDAPIWQDPAQPLEKRVDDLLSRMTLEEKTSQLLSQSPAIDRLGVPAYDWWNECLHGVARAGRATVFPEPIGIAATWDTGLLFRVATAISDEARAKHEEFVRRGKRGIYQGLTFWTPNINIFRDPRWGRGMETYGEDPYLTGQMAIQFVRGMQGDDPKYLKAISTAKHYAVHSGPESTRHVADIEVDPTDLRDTYLPQFEAAVRTGGAQSVMCAYNSVDGKPACASPMLLADILRGEWKFPGYVVSDCDAVEDIYATHKAAASPEAAVAMAVKAGTDLDCGLMYSHVLAAVNGGLLSEQEVDTAVRRLLTARFRLGMFDPPEMVRWTKIPYSVNDSPEHARLALQTARESIVLLKNEGSLLPLKKDVKTIAVIGPNADSVELLLGNYNGQPSHPVTPLAGIRQKVSSHTRVLYARGTDLAPGIPSFETVPTSALYTGNGPDKQHGLRAEYFDTANFNGRAYIGVAFASAAMRKAATIPQNPQPLFTRIDPAIDFDWADGAPRAGMNDDNFGVRWTGYLSAPVSGKYQLGASGLNAYEVYLDGREIAHLNSVHERAYSYATVDLEADRLYAIRVDFHEVHGDADMRLVWAPPHADYTDEAMNAARQSDVILVFLGLSPRLEGEEMSVHVAGFAGGDRIKLGIPQVQEELLQRISALGKPVVLVLLNGSAIAVNWAHDHVPAIVELWYPGQAGGTALADVLFGDSNPGGRLPITFYKSEDQLPPFYDYHMKGRTYRYFEGDPLYPFGYGLSYTRFAYRNLRLPETANTGEPIHVSVDLENSGPRAGDEVVELYLRHDGVPGAPIRSLEGFRRVSLAPHEKRSVEFTLTARQLSTATATESRVSNPGVVEISVGGKQPGFTGPSDAATTQVLTGRCTISGDAKPLE
jgi:beta-glucosidase